MTQVLYIVLRMFDNMIVSIIMVFVIVGLILYYMWSFGMACVFDSLGIESWKAFVPIYRWDTIYHNLFDDAKDLSRSFPQKSFYLSLICLFIMCAEVEGMGDLLTSENFAKFLALLPFIWLAICLAFVFGVVVIVCTCEIDVQVAKLCGIAHYGMFSVGMLLLPFVFWPILSLRCDNELPLDETQ